VILKISIEIMKVVVSMLFWFSIEFI